jgi:hypothetical protein
VQSVSGDLDDFARMYIDAIYHYILEIAVGYFFATIFLIAATAGETSYFSTQDNYMRG